MPRRRISVRSCAWRAASNALGALCQPSALIMSEARRIRACVRCCRLRAWRVSQPGGSACCVEIEPLVYAAVRALPDHLAALPVHLHKRRTRRCRASHPPRGAPKGRTHTLGAHTLGTNTRACPLAPQQTRPANFIGPQRPPAADVTGRQDLGPRAVVGFRLRQPVAAHGLGAGVVVGVGSGRCGPVPVPRPAVGSAGPAPSAANRRSGPAPAPFGK